jgi:hypothetical protein
VELVIALALTGIVLAAASASLLRQQRGFRWVGAVTGAESQMRPLSQVLSSELALLDPGAGDLVPGQASDSAIQVRVAIASSVSCDSAASAVTLVPESASDVALGGSGRAATPGDSLWFIASDSLGWQGRRIVAADRASASCSAPLMADGATPRLTLSAPMDMPGATPVRVTRQERYQFYRAADGARYLGISEWSTVLGRFAPPQPIAGPFVRSARADLRTSFVFFDATGAMIVPNGSNERTVTRLRVRGVAVVRGVGADSVRRDSVDVALVRRDGP